MLGLRKGVAVLRIARCGGVREEAEPGGGPRRSLTSACSWGSCRACTAPQSWFHFGVQSLVHCADLGTGPYLPCVCACGFLSQVVVTVPRPLLGQREAVSPQKPICTAAGGRAPSQSSGKAHEY